MFICIDMELYKKLKDIAIIIIIQSTSISHQNIMKDEIQQQLSDMRIQSQSKYYLHDFYNHKQGKFNNCNYNCNFNNRSFLQFKQLQQLDQSRQFDSLYFNNCNLLKKMISRSRRNSQQISNKIKPASSCSSHICESHSYIQYINIVLKQRRIVIGQQLKQSTQKAIDELRFVSERKKKLYSQMANYQLCESCTKKIKKQFNLKQASQTLSITSKIAKGINFIEISQKIQLNKEDIDLKFHQTQQIVNIINLTYSFVNLTKNQDNQKKFIELLLKIYQQFIEQHQSQKIKKNYPKIALYFSQLTHQIKENNLFALGVQFGLFKHSLNLQNQYQTDIYQSWKCKLKKILKIVNLTTNYVPQLKKDQAKIEILFSLFLKLVQEFLEFYSNSDLEFVNVIKKYFFKLQNLSSDSQIMFGIQLWKLREQLQDINQKFNKKQEQKYKDSKSQSMSDSDHNSVQDNENRSNQASNDKQIVFESQNAGDKSKKQ